MEKTIPTFMRAGYKPKSLMALQLDALESATFRGHKMGRFHNNKKNTASYANCVVCNKQVDVNTKPLPNDIEIGGEAVALGCSD